MTLEPTYAEFLALIRDSSAIPVNSEDCPVARTLNMIQGKWKAHILFFLCKNGACRFGEIHHAHPQISKTMLSSILKQLEQDGLAVRRQYNEMPPHTEYSLTDAGKELTPVFYEIFKWGTNHLANDAGER